MTARVNVLNTSCGVNAVNAVLTTLCLPADMSCVLGGDGVSQL